jgi:uncharacterized protein (DUF4415 family)
MNANNLNLGKAHLGSDMAKVASHALTSQEYDELPEISDADIARSTWQIEGKTVSSSEGRVAFSAAMKKQKINLTIDPDVLGWYRAQSGGKGYQTLINATLREAMRGQQVAETLRLVIRQELAEAVQRTK